MQNDFQQGIAPLPNALGFHITQNCNLRCKMCWFWGTHKIEPILQEMSTSQVKDLFTRVKSYIKFASIGGGEPLLRDDLLEILEFAHQEGIECQVLTNGTLITPDIAQGLLKWAASVVISLEGPKEINDSIRGEGNFDKAVNGITLLWDMPTRINSTISCLNYKHLDEIVNIACQLKCSLSFQHLIFWEGDELHKLDTQILIRKLNTSWGRAYNLRVSYSVSPELLGEREIELWYSGLTPIRNMYCPFPWAILFIRPDGEVMPCEFVNYSYGNILTEDIEDIWNGDKARHFRKSLLARLPDTCARCCKLELRR